MGTVIYQRSNRLLMFLGVVFAAIGVAPLTVIAIVDEDARSDSLLGAGLLLLLGAFVVGLVAVTTASRLEVSDEGLRAVRTFRTKEFRWSDLRSVSSPWYDYANATIVWRSATGRVVTNRNFVGFYKLLAELPQRAPQAEISSKLC